MGPEDPPVAAGTSSASQEESESTRAERLGRVVDAARTINDVGAASGDVELVLALIAENLCSLLPVSRCAVYLFDARSNVYRGRLLRVEGKVDDSISKLECGVEADGLTREILLTKRPVFVTNAKSDPRPIRSMMFRAKVQALLGIPMIAGGSVIGLLYADDNGRPLTITESDQAIAMAFAGLTTVAVEHARAVAELGSTIKKVKRQNDAFRRAGIAESELSGLLLEGAGLDEIAASVANLTHKACAIYGADRRRLAGGVPAGSDESYDLLEPADCKIPEVARALAGLRASTPSVIGPFLVPGLAKRLLISPISVGGEEWGRLVIRESQSAFTAFDAHVGRRAATIIALEMSVRRRAAESQQGGIDALLRDLISGVGDGVALRERAEFHQLPVNDRSVMCLICPGPDGKLQEPSTDEIVSAFRRVEGAMVVRVREGTAVVVPSPAHETGIAVRDRISEVVGVLTENGGCLVGVSSPFATVEGYSRAYEEAWRVVRCLRTFAGTHGGHLLFYEDLGSGAVFLASISREEADAFVHQTFGPLLAPENRTMSDLLETAASLLTQTRNVRQTAEQLGVHENTIRYRLARVAELTGLDLATDADHQLAGQMAVMILQLQGRLGPRNIAPLVTAPG